MTKYAKHRLKLLKRVMLEFVAVAFLKSIDCSKKLFGATFTYIRFSHVPGRKLL